MEEWGDDDVLEVVSWLSVSEGRAMESVMDVDVAGDMGGLVVE